jgi:hypothetical protein
MYCMYEYYTVTNVYMNEENVPRNRSMKILSKMKNLNFLAKNKVLQKGGVIGTILTNTVSEL